jgi:hypothetical protein
MGAFEKLPGEVRKQLVVNGHKINFFWNEQWRKVRLPPAGPEHATTLSSARDKVRSQVLKPLPGEELRSIRVDGLAVFFLWNEHEMTYRLPPALGHVPAASMQEAREKVIVQVRREQRAAPRRGP